MASVEPRKNKDGKITSYRVEWTDKGKRTRMSFKTQGEADKWKALLEAVGEDTKQAERALLRQSSQSPTFEEVARGHIERLINVRDYTIKRYKGYIKNHFEPISHLPVDQVTEDDMIRWIKYMLKKDCSPKTIANVHGFIHAAMNSAVRRRLRPTIHATAGYCPRMTRPKTRQCSSPWNRSTRSSTTLRAGTNQCGSC